MRATDASANAAAADGYLPPRETPAASTKMKWVKWVFMVLILAPEEGRVKGKEGKA
jgi:energy-coupling factor transporter transmembrane protein EcfT